MTFEEAKNAILEANEHFKNRSDGTPAPQTIEGKKVNIIFGTAGMTWNYGIPNLYVMDQKHLVDLEAWWKKIHENTGTVLRPEFKVPGVLAVNLQWVSEGGTLFNFHLPVTQ